MVEDNDLQSISEDEAAVENERTIQRAQTSFEQIQAGEIISPDELCLVFCIRDIEFVNQEILKWRKSEQAGRYTLMVFNAWYTKIIEEEESIDSMAPFCQNPLKDELYVAIKEFCKQHFGGNIDETIYKHYTNFYLEAFQFLSLFQEMVARYTNQYKILSHAQIKSISSVTDDEINDAIKSIQTLISYIRIELESVSELPLDEPKTRDELVLNPDIFNIIYNELITLYRYKLVQHHKQYEKVRQALGIP